MKLNRTQITKALECCHSTNVADCRNCAYRGKETEFGCTNLLVKDALSLIEELTKENERLQVENAEQDQAIVNALIRMGEIRRETKMDTVQEMRIRLKRDLFYKCGDINYSEVCDTRRLIDQIATEILEGNK